MVVVPPTKPVTGTATEVPPAAKVAVAGTVAVPGLSDVKVTVKPPAGAGAERVRLRFCVVFAKTVRVFGVNVSAADTCTVWLPEV